MEPYVETTEFGTMPRFFFHIWCNDHGLSRDELGLDFPDVETARGKALRAAQDLESVFAARGQDPRDYALQVENALGELVFYLPFSEIFDDCAVASHH